MYHHLSLKILVVVVFTVFLANSIQAEEISIANVNITEQSITIQGNDGFSNVTFTIRGPGDYYIQNYLGNEKISMVIDDFSTLNDGHYKYELTATTSEKSMGINQNYSSGRETNSTDETKPALQSGGFLIKGGYVLTSDKRINNKRMMPEGADQDEV